MIFSSRDRPASSSSRLRRIAQADPRATESPTCSVPFFSELGSGLRDRRAWAPRAFVGIVARRPPSHIEPEWTLVPGPFLCVMANSGCFAAAGTAMAVMAPGRTKSSVGGHQSVRGTVIKLPNAKAESAEGWPAKRGKKHVEVPHPAGRVFAVRRPSRLGRSRARPLTNFTFWGRLPPKYAGALREQNES